MLDETNEWVKQKQSNQRDLTPEEQIKDLEKSLAEQKKKDEAEEKAWEEA